MDKVIELLDLADVEMQKLGLDSERTYELHNKIQDLIDELAESA